MGYWDKTAKMIASGQVPNCPKCGKKMFPQDDHGRFTCFCLIGSRPYRMSDLSKDMPKEYNKACDEREKEQDSKEE